MPVLADVKVLPEALDETRRKIAVCMALDPKVFKAYDVRGIYPSELDEEGAYAIGRAYVEQFEPKTIAVGRDMRVSSPSIARGGHAGAPPTAAPRSRTSG